MEKRQTSTNDATQERKHRPRGSRRLKEGPCSAAVPGKKKTNQQGYSALQACNNNNRQHGKNVRKAFLKQELWDDGGPAFVHQGSKRQGVRYSNGGQSHDTIHGRKKPFII